jgi:hypothetical protein
MTEWYNGFVILCSFVSLFVCSSLLSVPLSSFPFYSFVILCLLEPAALGALLTRLAGTSFIARPC